MKFTKIKEWSDDAKNTALNIAVVGAGYIALNAVICGGQYLTEKIKNRIIPEEKKELVLKLNEKKEILLPVTHSIIDAGNFETLEGKIIRITDLSKVSEGKFLPNEYIHMMKKDSTYRVEFVGSEKAGYTILGFERK